MDFPTRLIRIMNIRVETSDRRREDYPESVRTEEDFRMLSPWLESQLKAGRLT
jgi:hypothetical protein